jgi:hypothetical protein
MSSSLVEWAAQLSSPTAGVPGQPKDSEKKRYLDAMTNDLHHVQSNHREVIISSKSAHTHTPPPFLSYHHA